MTEKSPRLTCTRRGFLQAGAAFLAGMASSRHILAQNSGPTEGKLSTGRKVRLGVVGGGFGASFQWHEHPDCIVQAVSDLRADRRQVLMDSYRCPTAYNSLEELIKDKQVDAVAVFTGAPDHVRHVVACLRAGKHVICAVPAAFTLEECEELVQAVAETGLTYMMAETSYYHPAVISARKWHAEGRFGRIFYCEAEYHHPGLEALFTDEKGNRTWRWAYPPMHYPTHCTAYLVGVTGERLRTVTCTGWGDDAPCLKDNAYHNPFWNETAFFTTDRGNAFRVAVYWNAPVRGTERGEWYGTRMSLFDPHPNGMGAVIVRPAGTTEKDDAGFVRALPDFESYPLPRYWETDMLPEPLRHDSGHEGSHTFLTHEFIDALVHGRRPAIDVYEAVAYTAPGIVAHQSALQGGKQLDIRSFDRE